MKTIIQVIFITVVFGSTTIAQNSKIPAGEQKVIKAEDYKGLYSNIPEELKDLFTKQKNQGEYIIEYTGWGLKQIFSAIKKDKKYIRHGVFQQYLMNGSPNRFSSYFDGKLDGPQVSYFRNARMEHKQFYKKGKRDGRCIRWNLQGLVTTDCIFKNGVPMNGFSFRGSFLKKCIISTYKDGKPIKEEPCDIFGNTKKKNREIFKRFPDDIKKEEGKTVIYGLIGPGALNIYSDEKPKAGSIMKVYRDNKLISEVKIAFIDDNNVCLYDVLDKYSNKDIFFYGDKVFSIKEKESNEESSGDSATAAPEQ